MPTDTNQLREVARRIREMRWITGHTPEEMAALTEVTADQYRLYEEGETDLPFTFMHSI